MSEFYSIVEHEGANILVLSNKEESARTFLKRYGSQDQIRPLVPRFPVRRKVLLADNATQASSSHYIGEGAQIFAFPDLEERKRREEDLLDCTELPNSHFHSLGSAVFLEDSGAVDNKTYRQVFVEKPLRDALFASFVTGREDSGEGVFEMQCYLSHWHGVIYVYDTSLKKLEELRTRRSNANNPELKYDIAHKEKGNLGLERNLCHRSDKIFSYDTGRFEFSVSTNAFDAFLAFVENPEERRSKTLSDYIKFPKFHSRALTLVQEDLLEGELNKLRSLEHGLLKRIAEGCQDERDEAIANYILGLFPEE